MAEIVAQRPSFSAREEWPGSPLLPGSFQDGGLPCQRVVPVFHNQRLPILCQRPAIAKVKLPIAELHPRLDDQLIAHPTSFAANCLAIQWAKIAQPHAPGGINAG